jgi:hypothetical protein
MLTEEPHDLVFISQTKDHFGTVTNTKTTPFKGYVEEKSVVEYVSGKLEEVGKGKIFTTASLDFDFGTTLGYRGKEYKVAKVDRLCGLDGEFSHWELVYG